MAMRIGSMPCLIAVVKADVFDEAMEFVDGISALAGNQVKSRKKHLIIISPIIMLIIVMEVGMIVKRIAPSIIAVFAP